MEAADCLHAAGQARAERSLVARLNYSFCPCMKSSNPASANLNHMF
jgi:hypothetical protein